MAPRLQYDHRVCFLLSIIKLFLIVLRGNNAIAYKKNMTSITTSQLRSKAVFNYTYDSSLAPAEGSNVDAGRTNAFYLANTFHDTLYLYGFTEAAFNFQNDNFGKGGLGNDRIQMSVQDNTGFLPFNNALFATPPEYVWFPPG